MYNSEVSKNMFYYNKSKKKPLKKRVFLLFLIEINDMNFDEFMNFYCGLFFFT